MRIRAAVASVAGVIVVSGAGVGCSSEQPQTHMSTATSTTTATLFMTPREPAPPVSTGEGPIPSTTVPPLAAGPTIQPYGGESSIIVSKTQTNWCEIHAVQVACTGRGFAANYDKHGGNYAAVNVDGEFGYFSGNGDGEPVRLDYKTYRTLGWTIVAKASGLTFTNDRTHHGMWVGIDEAKPF